MTQQLGSGGEMKRAIACLLLTALIACAPASDQPGTTQPIFRHFNTEVSSIRLGDRWTAEEVPGAEPSDTVVALPSGTFEKAQAVRVHRSPAGVVSSIMFDYPQDADFDAMREEYTRLFGPPAEHERSGNAEARERLVWVDSLTLFELVRDPRRSVSTIYTRLIDRPGPGGISNAP
jgi:hypothetical protein